jgi:hypothetical protein
MRVVCFCRLIQKFLQKYKNISVAQRKWKLNLRAHPAGKIIFDFTKK